MTPPIKVAALSETMPYYTDRRAMLSTQGGQYDLTEVQVGPPGGIERRLEAIRAGVPEYDPTEPSSRAVLEEYLEKRAKAASLERPTAEALANIQQTVGGWLTEEEPIIKAANATASDYSYDHPLGARQKIVRLIDHLALNYGDDVSKVELEASRLFLRSAYAMYATTPTDGTIHPDADGSFAFLVPARMSRQNTEYGAEVESVIPVFRYIPNEMRASMMLGLPPFVIDTYPRDEMGRRGYLVFVPVFPDSRTDLAKEGIGTAVKIARQKVDNAVELAHNRLGADIIALGAMLPSMTNYGQSIRNPHVVTTSGHGGTVQLILETAYRAIQEGRIGSDKLQTIGILGLGAIGEPTARILHNTFPDSKIHVYDKREKPMSQLVSDIGAVACHDERELLESSGIIVTALPDISIDLRALNVSPERMAGKLIIDDSQPGVYDGKQVQDYGAILSWVVGQQYAETPVVRGLYTYGDTLVGRAAMFGCECEGIVLDRKCLELEAQGLSRAEALEYVRPLAVQGPVTVENVRDIGSLFRRNRISAAPLQAAGKLL